MPSLVGLYRCEKYDPIYIEEVLESAFEANQQWLSDIKQGTTVFLKLNLLLKKKPEEAVTTHPALIEALVRILQKKGAIITLGDSPGGPYLPSRLKSIYRTCGIEKVAEKTGAELNYDVEETHVPFPEGKVSKSFQIISPVLKADKVISLPKLKTHMMTKYTGAVKNQFGVIPGLKKADYHLKMHKIEAFSNMLIDLSLCVNPALHIMDAVIGMEGNGPSGGIPRKVGALIISSDPFALDVAALKLVKIRADLVPTVKGAVSRGLVGTMRQVAITGNSMEEWDIPPFLVPKISDNVRFPIPEFITRPLRPKPYFLADKCIECGDCADNCPPRALRLTGQGKPQLDLKSCIRCFCCQELCPKQAVVVKRNPLGRILEK